jgi:glycosyltransferase involved in cell wall biosynthesis
MVEIMIKTLNNQPLVSVVMPVFNASYSVSKALLSVLGSTRADDVEIIVVDDCSTDNTVEIVKDIQQSYPHLLLFSMPQNSGGPSAPRNLGIEKARGEYVTFLDDDDWIDVSSMLKMADLAKENNYDFVRGYLVIVKGEQREISNRLHTIPTNTKDTMKSMVAYQSTSSDFLVRRDILVYHSIRYPTDIKIGEDSVFTFEVLAHCNRVKYIDTHFLYYVQRSVDSTNLSSTQQCGDRELNHQITAWERSEKILSSISLSYYDLRLHIGFRNVLLSIVRFSDGISQETYRRLNQFALKTQAKIRNKMSLQKRYDELYKGILSGDYKEYLKVAKRRLLICGYDLKFVSPLVPYLSKEYEVQVDEWLGHNAHNKKQSESSAEWADIIWCEWLLGNAVFYSKWKNKDQRLIIRAHGFEVERFWSILPTT